MILYIKSLKEGLGVFSFYELLFTDKKFIEKLKDIVYFDLVMYGKIATKGKDSLGNKDNMHLSVGTDGGDLEVDFHWGKTNTERARFSTKIRNMNKGTTDVPSIEELVDWVRGKEIFFKENPFMLGSDSAFFNRMGELVDERDYAELLQEKLEEKGVFSDGKSIFRGQSKYANSRNPIKPTYTIESKSFIRSINEIVEKEIINRYNSISEKMVDKILSHNSGGVEYVVAIDDDMTVNIINTNMLSDIVVDWIRNDGVIEIEFNEEKSNEFSISSQKIALKIDRVSSSLFDKINRMIMSDINSLKNIDIKKYSSIVEKTISKIKIK